ncbi:unnamed protein product [Ectocarpus sp. CCAP 1310/34]|nr:unnamed protein product [Ectocarpus sp. CCAP 1310/34]
MLLLWLLGLLLLCRAAVLPCPLVFPLSPMFPPPPPRLSPPVTRAYAPTLSDALFLAASVSA